MSDEKPQEKPTERMSKDEIQRQLLDKVLAGVEATRAEVANVRIDVSEVKTDVAEVKKDVAILGENHKDLSQRATITDRRLTEFEEWRARTSERVKDETSQRSKVDLEHQAQLVHIEERFKAMTEAQTNQIAGLVKDAAKTPLGQKILGAAGLVVLALLGVAYARLQGQQAPAPVPVIIQMSADGGAK